MADAAFELHPKFLVDESGEKQAVLLSFAEYEAVLELIEDHSDALALDRAVANATGFRDLDEVIADLQRDGLM